MVLLKTISDYLTITPLPHVYANSHPSLSTFALPPASHLSHSQSLHRNAKILRRMFLHPSHAHLRANLCFCSGANGL